METHSPSKRRRTVTTCTECHRRKQKCNRARPCNVCLARNVPEKCFYDSLASGRSLHEPQERQLLSQPACQTHEAQRSLSAPPPELPDQVGYSSRYDSNAFIGLKRSLQIVGDRVTSGNNSVSSLPPQKEEKVRTLVDHLPQNEVAKELVEIFFSEANWYFLVLERYYFNELHDSWIMLSRYGPVGNLGILPRELQYFPALLFQVLAVALQFLPPSTKTSKILHLEDSSACDQVSLDYSTAGTDIMHLLGRHDSTLTAVQQDLMRALWLKNRSRGTESWYSLGDAIRQAQDLGLHLQSPVIQAPGATVEETLNRLWYDEYKRRLWATLFTWDSHMALILGRPRTINASDCTITTPIDCNIPDEPSKKVPAVTHLDEAPSLYSAHLFHYALAHKVHEMLSKGADKRHFKDYGVIQDIHDQVISLLNDLPPATRPENPDVSWDLLYPPLPKQRQHILSAAHSFLMALHRPHVAVHAVSRQAAIQAGLGCLEAQQCLFEQVSESHYSIYTLSFYTIDAAIFLSATAIENPPGDRLLLEKIYLALGQAISRLTVMRKRSAMANSGLNLLISCYHRMGSAQTDLGWLNQAEPPAHRSTQVEGMRQYNMTNASKRSSLQWPCQGPGNIPQFDSHGRAGGQLGHFESPGSSLFVNASDSDMSPSSWMTQVDQMVNLDPGAPISDSIWSSLLG